MDEMWDSAMFILRFVTLAAVLVIGPADDQSLPEPPRTRVDFDVKQPVVEKGVIKAKGTFSVEDGFEFVQLETRVHPSAGGVLTRSFPKRKDGKWSDEITLSPGTYDVMMWMTLKSRDTGKETVWASRLIRDLKVN
jgi:hypothetical protein